jgi:hypothetical protein
LALHGSAQIAEGIEMNQRLKEIRERQMNLDNISRIDQVEFARRDIPYLLEKLEEAEETIQHMAMMLRRQASDESGTPAITQRVRNFLKEMRGVIRREGHGRGEEK